MHIEYRWIIYAAVLLAVLLTIIILWRVWQSWPRFVLVDGLPFYDSPEKNRTQDSIGTLRVEDPLYDENWITNLGLLTLQELNGHAVLKLDRALEVIIRCLGVPCERPAQGTPEFRELKTLYAPARATFSGAVAGVSPM